MIENAVRGDFPTIAALNLDAYAEFADRLEPGGWDAMRLNLCRISELAERAQFLVVREGRRIAGSVAYCPAGRSDPALFGPNAASVLLLAVHSGCRGQGLARRLVEACVDRARRDGAVEIGLFTSELMTHAQRLYRDLGFRFAGELQRRYGVRYFRYVMELGAAEEIDPSDRWQTERIG